jgi:uncharacterized YccA/Bax inhibitor family protein
MANAVLERAINTGPAQAGAATIAVAPPSARVVDDAMSTTGVATATGVLFVLLLAAGYFGWNAVDASPEGTIDFPSWILIAILGGFGLAILVSFRPNLARPLAPVYALVEGVILGAISRVFESQWDGIVVQAVLATASVFAVMLFVYGTRLIKVTDRLRRVVIVATFSVMIFYLVSLLFSLFGLSVPLVWDAGPAGILFSLAVIALAAFNLLLDFDLVTRGVEKGLPRSYEWYCAFGLMVSIVWLYLEILRLLAKLRQ